MTTEFIADEYEQRAQAMCQQVSDHVHRCKQCQRRLSFDPVEKALLKTHSLKNEIFELLAFVSLGIVVVLTLRALR